MCAIAALRTALAFFLGREIKDVTDEEAAEQRHESHAHSHAQSSRANNDQVAQSETGSHGEPHEAHESAAGDGPMAKLPSSGSAHSKKRR